MVEEKIVLVYRGSIDAEAEAALVWRETPWPRSTDDQEIASPYRDAFHLGATIVPRMLSVVEASPLSPLGGNPEAPVVESRRTRQEKPPWKDLAGLRANIEKEFLRPLYLGESVAPFRLLDPVLAVIPWDGKGQRLLDSMAAQQAGHLHLSRWLQQTERLWADHRKGDLSLTQQLDYYGKLSAQFTVPPLWVVYSKAGALPAAALLADTQAIIDHTRYWAGVSRLEEARYLLGVLNSETARSRRTFRPEGSGGVAL